MKHLDLFSGIGGFALATEMVWENVEHVFCDNDPFSQKILEKHWPNAPIYGDIRTLTADAERERYLHRKLEKHATKPKQQTLSQPTADFHAPFLLTGGFPCQPFSQAGRRRGTEDDRHLWPEMLRVIREFSPRWVIGENVGGLVTWSGGLVLEQVHTDLESEGYDVQAFIIPAVSLNAPHRRDRVWIVAHTQSERHRGRPGEVRCEKQRSKRQQSRKFGGTSEISNASHSDTGRIQRHKRTGTKEGATARGSESWNQNWLEVATRLCTVDDGIQGGLARPRGWRNAALKGAGNAIVPQVAAEIMRGIKEIDER